jgi:hypothetical protein
VVSDAAAVGPAALDEIQHPERQREARCSVARDMFYEPGTATDRALDMVYELLDLPAAVAHSTSRAARRAA